MNANLAITIVTTCVLSIHLGAQTPAGKSRGQAPSELQVEIARMDSALFAAFNARDLAKLQTFFASDLEFYQDNEGVENYAQTKKDFGQMFGQAAPIRRELVPGSLEVFPIKNYGAMEVGRHRFCHDEGGKEDCGTFSFVHIWRRTNSGWQIARVNSYGHEPSHAR